MHKLDLSYAWTPDAVPATHSPPSKPAVATAHESVRLHNPMLDVLHAVQECGSISAAARMLQLSYRHVWGELKRWEGELGHDLLIWEKGQAARLSRFGTKLLWAERQAQARVTPQLETVRAELERAYALAFDDQVHVLTLYASHDEALSQLRSHGVRNGLHLDLRFTGSIDALRALNEDRCVLAGFHTRVDTASRSLTQQTCKPLLQPGRHKLIGFATRTQGLMVAPGNPLRLHTLADLRRARLVNRPVGTGTRLLLDELIGEHGLHASELQGYTHTEPSHLAVAQRIASGAADAGLGIAAAAQARGLGFVPLLQERYHLVCLKTALHDPGVQALCELLQGEPWRQRMMQLPGYALDRESPCGEILAMRRLLPWWNYRTPKPASAPSKPAE